MHLNLPIAQFLQDTLRHPAIFKRCFHRRRLQDIRPPCITTNITYITV